MRVGRFTVAAVLGLTAWAPPAHADPESMVIVCDGTVEPGTLSRSYVNDVANSMSCTREHLGTTSTGTPELWYSGPLESSVSNYDWAVPGVNDTVGSFYFVVGGTQWVVVFGETTVGGFMPLGVSEGDVVASYGNEPPYHIRAGWIDDADSHTFHFVAEYVYDV